MCYEKVVRPSRRRLLVEYLKASYGVSERHACKVLEMRRTTYRYEDRQERWTEFRMREIAQTRVRYGYRMIRVLLNREGWEVGGTCGVWR